MSNLTPLTKKQKEVFDFIKNYISENGISPTIEETRKKLKLKAISTIHEHVKFLEEKGYLKKQKGKKNSIQIEKNRNKDLVQIPILGNIAAGYPIEAIEITNEFISIPKNEIKTSEKYYALNVKGDSMMEEGIFDGDTVIIRQQNTANNGEMVVAIVDDNLATLKKIYKEKNGIRLQPANQNLLPFYRTEVEIRGVVEKIIRNLTNSLIKNENEKLVISDHTKIEKIIDNDSIFLEKKYVVNKIYNVDCLELMKKIKNESIELIFADPPYNLSGSNFKMKFKNSGGKDLNTNKGNWDIYTDADFEEFTKKWLTESFRILKKNGAIWVAGSYHNIYLTGYLMKKIGFEILNEVLWHKSDATPNLSCTRFVADHENFIWARKGKGNTFNYDIMKKLNGGKQMRSIWTKGKTAGGKRVHPTQKPEWLLERIIAATSNPTDIVFDPFLGSGTTAVVAKKCNRKYLGSELDKDYFKLAENRIKNT